MSKQDNHLNGKSLVMLIGPTAVGKSTIMNEVVRIDDRFSRATGFTTRDKRPNDEPGQYRYLSSSDVAAMSSNGQVLQSITNPANGQIYGTSIEDYPGVYNMKDTLSIAVEEFERIPFKKHITLSLTVPVNHWRKWLDSRYPQPNAERTRRLLEAKQSVQWSLSQRQDHQWLVNLPGEEGQVARRLIELVQNSQLGRSVPEEPQNMLKMIDDLLLYG